ncbi:MAG TPA: hypothetical protein VNK04_07910 [Gemmataceae bacterium]|nr:hypothetical protein [Gemmataceae bacterium]
MRTFLKVALTLGAVLLVAGPALSQPQQRQQRGQQQRQPGQFAGRGFFGGPAMLVMNEDVQKELKMTEDQIGKAKEVLSQLRDKQRDTFAQLRNLGEQERRQKMQELSRAIASDTYTALNTVLKPEQVKRLKQIELQQRGYEAFTEPEVRKALNLTESQVKEIDAIVKGADAERDKLFQGGFQQGTREKLQTLRKETMTKITGLLKEDQKKAWKELTGEPFEVRFQPRRPGNG